MRATYSARAEDEPRSRRMCEPCRCRSDCASRPATVAKPSSIALHELTSNPFEPSSRIVHRIHRAALVRVCLSGYRVSSPLKEEKGSAGAARPAQGAELVLLQAA